MWSPARVVLAPLMGSRARVDVSAAHLNCTVAHTGLADHHASGRARGPALMQLLLICSLGTCCVTATPARVGRCELFHRPCRCSLDRR